MEYIVDMLTYPPPDSEDYVDICEEQARYANEQRGVPAVNITQHCTVNTIALHITHSHTM